LKTLFVGFKGKNNPSNMLVNTLDCDRLFLTNSFPGIDRDIENTDLSKYDRVVLSD
jgi:hypothetical protein